MPCTVDCLSTYGCGAPIQADNGAVFAPYIKLEFGGGRIITVGNASAPPDNHATISSFQYGFTPGSVGYGADFEIIDQGGVMYRRIIRALNKTITRANGEVLGTHFDFGWIVKDCNGQTWMTTAQSLTGKKLHGMFTGVEQTYEGGKVKLKFRLEGPQNRIPDVRHDDTEGDEDNKITLKDALRRLFEENQPNFSSVEFKNKDDGELCFHERDGGCDGPLGAWPHNQQNPLAAARTWLSSVVTENDRGILILYDPDSSNIVFQEDKNNPQGGDCCGQTLGTYIVNGGNCSPVLEFNPTIKWPLGFIPGGGATPPGSASGANDDYVEPTREVQHAGTQTGPAVQQHEWMWRNPDDLSSRASEGNAAHMEANRLVEGPVPGFSAELKIYGDPSYCDPVKLVAKTVAVIVINPFHLNDQCTWVTTSNCNAIMSNKKYLVQGVSHQITGGSFVTTLKLFLAQPNKDIDATEPLGGSGCGTETFNDDPGASEATDANE